ncbi:MAG: 16S rRNA processing protein RimM [Alphaproteobacteria bacterium RIFCSPLOWO2_01_FULL_45_8]|nr:MAG: 16S rRNA processing protein RimM [Alphaproteobacteria bacterium GWB1_45_5]OFW76522.1 MAG: 16S rRNA processing protein RimM [Alphaproteobacteria bacterium GWA1_45_9]OFW90306.1 MAG: 16S rRNA processing protein RimM [Alphaproteobacteria bacterium RIFCSPHIGHO2_01_FULL_41_14]OFW95775.1 MAG: 16S rRNA processing protein RimM [Alphaproteobacteria bacterium RIFCSPLOWO2_01_FULL_45_8]HCI48603.1 16S rRNA processing protein RimM [Holosporales bacterium]
MSEPKKNNKVCVASISGAQGIRGELKIRVYLDTPSDIGIYSPLFFEDGSEFSLKVIRSLANAVIASTPTIKDRDQALKLRGEKLYVRRDQLPAVDADTYYHTDLMGLPVQNESGTVVGVIKYVDDYGAGTVLEVFDPVTCRSVLVPFQDASVPFIDLDSHMVIKDQYLTDLYEE